MSEHYLKPVESLVFMSQGTGEQIRLVDGNTATVVGHIYSARYFTNTGDMRGYYENARHLMDFARKACRSFNAHDELVSALSEKLECTLSTESFADDLDLIADNLTELGFNETAHHLKLKATVIRAAITKARGDAS